MSHVSAPAKRAPSPAKRGPTPWPACLVFLAGVAVYWASASCAFIKDDLTLGQLTQDGIHPDSGAILRNFLWPTGLTHDQFYRPLPVLFGAFDLWAFGPNPLLFRICNVGFHALNGVLLALLVNRLTGWRRAAVGWLAGLLFALHPLHAEAVLWITQRMVVQCLTWHLLTALCFTSWLRHRRRSSLVLTVVFAAAACLTKEVSAAMPAMLVVLAWFVGQPAGVGAFDRRRLQLAAKVTGLAALIPAFVFGLRYTLFGTWEGTYGNLSPAAYAASRHVFERLPQSLINGFWAVNPSEASRSVRISLGIAWLVLLLPLPLLRLARGVVRGEARAAAAVLATFAVASFLPTLYIFYVDPGLTNGRFLYQPIAGLVGLVMCGFALPARPRSSLDLSVPAAAAVLFAVAGQINQHAYDGAHRQIQAVTRGIREQLEYWKPDGLAVVYDVPVEHHGVPTIDLYLPLLMSPPFQPTTIDAFPFVGGSEAEWPRALIGTDGRSGGAFSAWRDQPGHAERALLHLVYADDPPRVSPLFGAAESEEGAKPPTLVAPEDGAVVVCPGEEPVFVFSAVRGSAYYRLHFQVPGKRFVLDVKPSTHLVRSGTRLEYRFFRGNASGVPDMWHDVGAQSFPSPLPLQWRVEAIGAEQDTLGTSASRRMVVLNAALKR